jgi:hypothetical protein
VGTPSSSNNSSNNPRLRQLAHEGFDFCSFHGKYNGVEYGGATEMASEVGIFNCMPPLR